ncbi:MAG: carbohydrate ABC transporter permease [Defluviitaleaceae bacterium]|nr:carbohydrate ABC transporter permease [Defluviitaleaceae bacterium]
MKKLTKSEISGQVIMHIIFILATIIFLYPIILTFMSSIADETSLMRYGMRLIPAQFSLDAYRTVFSDNTILNAYLVTVLVTAIGTFLSVLICSMAGFALSIPTLKYRNKIALFFYIPMVFSAGLLPWFLASTQLYGLSNRPWALVLPMLVSPFNVFLARNYFRSIPPSLVEAAQIDGCSPMKTLISIIFPLSLPILATLGLFIGLSYWNDWSMALWFIRTPSLYPVQYMLFRIDAMMDHIRIHGAIGNMQLPTQTFRLATLFVTLGPIVLLYPFVQRYFVKGIMIGAVKG